MIANEIFIAIWGIFFVEFFVPVFAWCWVRYLRTG